MKKYLLLFGFFVMLKFSDAQTLDPHLWKDRVILLFTASRQDAFYQKQTHILTEKTEEVTERALKIYTILPGGGTRPGGGGFSAGPARHLYSTYGVTPGKGFTFVLIGKDGTEKLRKEEPVTARELFALIDSMPMRRAEMRRKRGGGSKKN